MERRVGWCQCYRQEKLRRQRRRFSQVNYRKFLERKYIHSRDVRIGLNIGAVVFFSEQIGTRNATQKVPLLICYFNKSRDIMVTREAAGSHLGKHSHVHAKAT